MAMRAIVGFTLAALIWMAPAPAPKPEPVGLGDLAARLEVYERRAALLAASNAEVEDRYRRDVQPIEAALLGRAVDPQNARRAAWAIVREAEGRHLSPALVAEILQAEDPWLVNDTVSSAGAVGWMQVMPEHVYEGHPCGTDLENGDVNVCYGTDILRSYLGDALSEGLRVALLRYNGCVATPGCDQYAVRIMDRLGAEGGEIR